MNSFKDCEMLRFLFKSIPILLLQVCSRLSTGNWTVERDDDMTGTYAYSEDGDWIAFDDELAAQIKVPNILRK